MDPPSKNPRLPGGEPAKAGRFANIKTFTLLVCVSMLAHQLAFAVQSSTITTVQKAYGLNTFDMGVWYSIYVVGEIISSVLVSYFAGQNRIPRILSVGMTITAFACMAHSLPHFILPYLSVDEQNASGRYYDDVCEAVSGDPASAINISRLLTSTESAQTSPACAAPTDRRNIVLAIYVIGNILIGLGYGPFIILPVVYIDDNASGKSGASFYQSLFYAMFYLGDVVGYSFASAMLSISVDLKEINMTADDPGWTGAWWLGYVVAGTAVLLCAVVMFFFPPSLTSPRAYSVPLDVHASESTSQIAPRDDAEDCGRPDEPTVDENEYREKLPSVKMLLPTVWCFLKNPLYLFTTLTVGSLMWIEAGYFPYLPKYLEVQFYQSASVASLETGLCSSLASSVGVVAGGLIISKFKLTLKQCTMMLLCGYVVGAALYVGTTFISCPQNVAMTSLMHNDSYSCYGRGYYPVCVNGTTYYSPCHAGCQNETMDRDGTMVLLNCHCGTEQGRAGVCTDECNNVVPYMILTVLAYGFPLMAHMSSVTILLKCVKPEQRGFSLAIHSELLSLIGYIPAPMTYGAVIDASCLTWGKSWNADGCTEDEQGNCLQYDNSQLRVGMHALTFGSQILGFTFAAFNCFFARTRIKTSTAPWGTTFRTGGDAAAVNPAEAEKVNAHM